MDTALVVLLIVCYLGSFLVGMAWISHGYHLTATNRSFVAPRYFWSGGAMLFMFYVIGIWIIVYNMEANKGHPNNTVGLTVASLFLGTILACTWHIDDSEKMAARQNG